MRFMLMMSIATMPLALLLPQLLVALVVVTMVSRYTRRRQNDLMAPVTSLARLCVEAAVLLVLPVLMLWWGLETWSRPGGPQVTNETTALVMANVLGFIELCLALTLIWRHRRRFALIVLVALGALWWTAGALATSAMAITDSWL